MPGKEGMAERLPEEHALSLFRNALDVGVIIIDQRGTGSRPEVPVKFLTTKV